jgi:hypothetical protein
MEFPLPRVGVRETGKFDLDADELGAVVATVFVKPVRVDKARGIVIHIRADSGQECIFLGH